MFEKISQPQLDLIYRKFRRIEGIVGDLLEKPQVEIRGLNPQAKPAFEEICLSSLTDCPQIELPELECERSIVVFAVLSNFYHSGWLLQKSTDSTDFIPKYYFSQGEVLAVEDGQTAALQLPSLSKGNVLKLKESPWNTLPLPIDPNFSRHLSTFLFHGGGQNRFLVSSKLGTPWLVDHVEATQSLLNQWI